MQFLMRAWHHIVGPDGELNKALMSDAVNPSQLVELMAKQGR
jgi:hypothetical protein